MENLSPEDLAALEADLIASEKADAERAARLERMGPCAMWEAHHNIVDDGGRAYQSLTLVLPRPAPPETVAKIARAVAESAGWDEATAAQWVEEMVMGLSPSPGVLPEFLDDAPGARCTRDDLPF